ncbi:glycoside hydrolase family 172 protein [Heyndrickxia faecalis]|uniref:glycoside hydrolase family 172 protein n=1 Tax=Heyndrickxia faecalis TaxID=2824910 RepID=UPI0035991DE1
MNILNNVTRFKGEQSRTISPENPTGEKGKACMFDSKLGPGRKGRGSISLPQGKETVIAEISGTGIIKHMWMTIRENTEKGSFVLRDVILRIYWDGARTPAVETPLGDFFCNGFGERYDVNSLPIVVNPNGGMNSYFEMPFRKKAKITITNEHPKDISSFFYTINYNLVDELDNDVLYFHAYWNRERQTKLQKDYVVIDNIHGHGYYVGTFLALTALERYWWGEGEFKFYIDGDEQYPTISSTGTEDYFGGAWAFHQKDLYGRPSAKNYSTLFLGYPFHSNRDATRDRFETGKLNAVHAFGDDGLPRHGLYRWHLLDPIAFKENLKVTLQQIGNDDIQLFEREDDVSTVAYWYQNSAEGAMDPIPDRRARLPR